MILKKLCIAGGEDVDAGVEGDGVPEAEADGCVAEDDALRKEQPPGVTRYGGEKDGEQDGGIEYGRECFVPVFAEVFQSRCPHGNAVEEEVPGERDEEVVDNFFNRDADSLAESFRADGGQREKGDVADDQPEGYPKSDPVEGDECVAEGEAVEDGLQEEEEGEEEVSFCGGQRECPGWRGGEARLPDGEEDVFPAVSR